MSDYSTAKSKRKKVPSEREIYQKSLQDLFSCRPVAYWPNIARKLGSVKAAVMLSQLLYWNGNKSARERGGWFWKTVKDLEDETGLSKREQQTARKALVNLKAIEAELRGVPRRWFYRVNMDIVGELFQWDPNRPTVGTQTVPLKDLKGPSNGSGSDPTAGANPASYSGEYSENKTGDDSREREALAPLPASSEPGAVVLSSKKEIEKLNIDACFLVSSKENEKGFFLDDDDPFKGIKFGIETNINYHELKFQFRAVERYNDINDIDSEYLASLTDDEFFKEQEELKRVMGPSSHYWITPQGIEKIKSYFNNDPEGIDEGRLRDVTDFFYWYCREIEDSFSDLTTLLKFYEIGEGKLLVKNPEVYRESEQIDLVRQVIGREPPVMLYPEIYKAVFDAVGMGNPYNQLETATGCYRTWIGKGYNPNNYDWLFDWFAKGTLPVEFVEYEKLPA